MAKPEFTPPNLYTYLDVVQFLNDWQVAKQRVVPSYTVGRLAYRSGISYSHVRNVLNGYRTLQGESVDGFIKALGLRGREALYFTLLCRYSRSSSLSERALILRSLAGLAVVAGAPLTERHLLALWSDLRNMCVYVAANAAAFRDDPAWVAQVLDIHPDAAAEALRELKGAGLLTVTPEGRLEQARTALPLTFEEQDPLQVRFLSFILQRLREATRTSAPQQRFEARTFRVVFEDLPEARAILRELYAGVRQAMVRRASSPDQPSTSGDVLLGLQVSMAPLHPTPRPRVPRSARPPA